jgi:hypothetical protein
VRVVARIAQQHHRFERIHHGRENGAQAVLAVQRSINQDSARRVAALRMAFRE